MRLPEIIENKLVPWAKDGFSARAIIARKDMTRQELPRGVTITPQKISGRRVIVKGRRIYGNKRNVIAKYPKAGLHETEAPRIVCVVQGDVNFQAGNYLFGCREGNIIVIPPRIPHPGDIHNTAAICSHPPDYFCTLLWITLYHQGVQCWMTKYWADRMKMDSAENFLFTQNRIVRLYNFLIQEIRGENNTLICDGLFVSLVGSLLQQVRLQHYLRPGLPPQLDVAPINREDFMAELHQYIQEHLDEALTMESVARGLFMSRAQLARRIKRETNQTFLELLNAYRLKESKRLLGESNWTSQTIAEFVGFKSSTYFSRFFREQIGCTPTEFREKYTAPLDISKKTDSN